MYNIFRNLFDIKKQNPSARMFYTRRNGMYTISMSEYRHGYEWNSLLIEDYDEEDELYIEIYDNPSARLYYQKVAQVYAEGGFEMKIIDTNAIIDINNMRITIDDKDKRLAELFELIGYSVVD